MSGNLLPGGLYLGQNAHLLQRETLLLLCCSGSFLELSAEGLVLADQDASGPGGSDQMSLMVLLQWRDVQVLGITVVTGDAWRDEEVQHTLRMLELIGRTDVPVVPGAVHPLVRTQKETQLTAQLYGKVNWLGAWGGGPSNLEQQTGHEGIQRAGPMIPTSFLRCRKARRIRSPLTRTRLTFSSPRCTRILTR